MADIKIQFGVNDENGTPVEIDKRYIDSLSSLSEITSDASSIEYGSLENSGSLVVYDRNDYIRELIRDEVIQTEGTPLSIVVNGKTVQKHISTDNTYDKNTKQLSMSLSNKMKDWSILKYKGFPYPKGTVEEAKRTAYEVLYDVMYTLYGSVWSDTSVFDEMLSENVIWGIENYKTTVKEYMSSVIIEYPVIESNRTYRDVIDEFCNMLQLQCYITDDDKVKFVSARPVIDSSDIKAIRVPLSNLYSDVEETIIPKNRIDGVEINEVVVLDKITSTNSACSSEDITVSPGNFEKSNYSAAYSGDSGDRLSALVKIEAFYTEGEFSVSKTDQNNLSQILSLSLYGEPDDDGFYKCIFSSSKNVYTYQGTVSNYSQFEQDVTPLYEENYFVLNPYYTNIDFSREGEGVINNIPTSIDSNYTLDGYSPKASISDDSWVAVKDNGDSFLFKYKTLSGAVTYHLSFWEGVSTSISYTIRKYECVSIVISMVGKIRDISLSTINNASSNDIELAKNKVSISSGKLLQENTTFTDGTKVSDNIKETILEDYKKGVPDAHFTVSCNNYYYQDGTLAVDWSKGEILQNENIVFFDGDLDKNGNQRYWKVTGRNLIYDNSPMVKVDVVQVKKVYTKLATAGLYQNGSLVYTWQEILDNNFLTYGTEQNLSPTDLTIENITGVLVVGEETLTLNPYALKDCAGLKGIQFNEGLTSLGYEACMNCSNVENILLPKTLTKIRDGCFVGCSSLKSINIPDFVTQINEQSFVSCKSLKHIFIPKSVVKISDQNADLNEQYPSLGYNDGSAPLFLNCSDSLVIFCEHTEKPEGWPLDWNYSKTVVVDGVTQNLYFEVKWGYTREQYEAEVGN